MREREREREKGMCARKTKAVTLVCLASGVWVGAGGEVEDVAFRLISLV